MSMLCDITWDRGYRARDDSRLGYEPYKSCANALVVCCVKTMLVILQWLSVKLIELLAISCALHQSVFFFLFFFKNGPN